MPTSLSKSYNSYPKVYHEYCVVAPSGFLTNHHVEWKDGKQVVGKRVTEETATHVIITTTKIEEINRAKFS